ncbi:MAG TPA: T9SS type A sorting domain-containing protein [Puia sp.]|nr:T9SS type A sorting domain-containing protein [Puia sp.]
MKHCYTSKIFLILVCCLAYFSSDSQVVWTKTAGSTGMGSFTISGTGSVSSINTDADIVFAKHGSGSSTYFTCDNCTINLQMTGQLVIDYPLYLTNSHIILGKTGFVNVSTTSGLSINGSASNPKQALFLDNSSSIQLASGANFIKLQSSPTAYIYFSYTGAANSTPASGAKRFAGTDNSPLCGFSSVGSSQAYTCNKGQANGPSILGATGFNIIAPLPVVLVDFTANLNNNKTVDLSWSTQMEVNLSHFLIQRSADGANWEVIGRVQANGNSQIVSNYSFNDPAPLDGLNYYRLQMTDLDNKSGLTIIKLIRTPIIRLFKVFPNPANDYVDITLSKAKNGNVRLLNQFGQVLQQKQVTATNDGTTLSFQLFGYPPGNYFVQVVAEDGSKEVGKFIIKK